MNINNQEEDNNPRHIDKVNESNQIQWFILLDIMVQLDVRSCFLTNQNSDFHMIGELIIDSKILQWVMQLHLIYSSKHDA